MKKFTRAAGTVFAAATIAVCVAPAAGAVTGAPLGGDLSQQSTLSASVPADHGHGPRHGGGYSYGYGYGYGSGPSSSSYGYQDPWNDADAGNYGECYQDDRPSWCDS